MDNNLISVKLNIPKFEEKKKDPKTITYLKQLFYLFIKKLFLYIEKVQLN